MEPPTIMKITKRLQNFSKEDELVLMTEVEKRRGDLFCKFSGPGGGRKRRTGAWDSVTDALNSQSSCVRSVHQVKKKFENIKSEAKAKVSSVKYPKTGGGPPAKAVTEAETIFLDMSGDTPSVAGIPGGLDSSVEFVLDPLEGDEAVSQTLDFEILHFPINNQQVEPIPGPSSSAEPVEFNLFPPPSSQKVKHQRTDLHQEVMLLEKRRIEAEILLAQTRMKQEMEQHLLKVEILKLKREKLMY